MGRGGRALHNALTLFAITSFAELTWEQLGGKLDRELRAAFLTTKASVPAMISNGYGLLIYLSTGLSRRPRDGMITLGTAKAALGPVCPVHRTRAGAAWDHRQPRRTGYSRGNDDEPAVDAGAGA